MKTLRNLLVAGIVLSLSFPVSAQGMLDKAKDAGKKAKDKKKDDKGGKGNGKADIAVKGAGVPQNTATKAASPSSTTTGTSTNH